MLLPRNLDAVDIYAPINIPRSLLISLGAFVRTCDISANINSSIYRMPGARPRTEFRPDKNGNCMSRYLFIPK